jgi:D-arginine dehydrogenase
MIACDIAIVGAGMAGASLAAAIGDRASVILLEAEAQPGYHATGRSAAFWSETYGGPAVQPLTTASAPLLIDPPTDFSDVPLTRPLLSVHLADTAGRPALDRLATEFAGSGVRLDRLDRPAIDALLPGVSAGRDDALLEPSTRDIDVAALHAAYLAQARRAGARLLVDAPLRSAEREGGRWTLTAGETRLSAAILVDAAGAWADRVAQLAGATPIGITPYRRTMVQARLARPLPADMPLIIDAAGAFYVKALPDGGAWLSPHDEAPAEAGDAAPEELDVALAIARVEAAFDWQVTRVERRWAGLRSFAPDRVPVYGFDPRCPGFFWCAGQGGFGIQTAPAAADLAARLLLGEGPGAVDPARYVPGRFA